MRHLRLWAVLIFLVSFSGIMTKAQAHQPGDFDYYLLSLSWEPEFCFQNQNRDSDECHHDHMSGFIVHGLWPASDRGPAEEYCSHAHGLADPAKALDIMPTMWLIKHEWQAHGTCSGLSPESYFNLMRNVRASVTIPDRFEHPTRAFSITPDAMKQAFINDNPGLKPQDMMLSCRGHYLSGAEICLNKTTLKPENCGVITHDCYTSRIKVAPVQ